MTQAAKSVNRKQEILQAALELFYKKGYENTTINNIIDELGVSKGAFYHYFESKEDVIISIAREYSERSIIIICGVINRSNLSAIDKMNEIIKAINEFKFREREWRAKFRGAIKSGENLKLQNKLIHYMKQDSIGLFAGLIDSGVDEGIFGDPINSRELAELFLNNIFALNIEVDEMENELYLTGKEFDEELFLKKMAEKVRFYEVMFNRMFQLQRGSFDLHTSYLIRVKGPK